MWSSRQPGPEGSMVVWGLPATMALPIHLLPKASFPTQGPRQGQSQHLLISLASCRFVGPLQGSPQLCSRDIMDQVAFWDNQQLAKMDPLISWCPSSNDLSHVQQEKVGSLGLCDSRSWWPAGQITGGEAMSPLPVRSRSSSDILVAYESW